MYHYALRYYSTRWKNELKTYAQHSLYMHLGTWLRQLSGLTWALCMKLNKISTYWTYFRRSAFQILRMRKILSWAHVDISFQVGHHSCHTIVRCVSIIKFSKLRCLTRQTYFRAKKIVVQKIMTIININKGYIWAVLSWPRPFSIETVRWRKW